MKATVESLTIRMNLLRERDPVGNAKIIAKLKRRIRALEG